MGRVTWITLVIGGCILAALHHAPARASCSGAPNWPATFLGIAPASGDTDQNLAAEVSEWPDEGTVLYIGGNQYPGKDAAVLIVTVDIRGDEVAVVPQ